MRVRSHPSVSTRIGRSQGTVATCETESCTASGQAPGGGAHVRTHAARRGGIVVVMVFLWCARQVAVSTFWSML
eukprot:2422307-Prymnesium_polylepis.1